ncbi:DUF2933 domain-containing protein [Allopusillimonas ginsengisoli]|nr:DUF2933 domain-containing protein [Allopusillimonas ginsengisoli]
MKCDMKMMIKTALGLGAVVAVAYATLPDAREWIAGGAPFLFFLICPLMMLFMMKAMHSSDGNQMPEKAQDNKIPSESQIGQKPLKE